MPGSTKVVSGCQHCESCAGRLWTVLLLLRQVIAAASSCFLWNWMRNCCHLSLVSFSVKFRFSWNHSHLPEAGMRHKRPGALSIFCDSVDLLTQSRCFTVWTFRHFDRFSPGGDKVDQVDPHSLCRQFRKWQLHSQCLPHLLLPVASCYCRWKWSGGIRKYQRHEINLAEFDTLLFCDPLGFHRKSTSESVACVTLWNTFNSVNAKPDLCS